MHVPTPTLNRGLLCLTLLASACSGPARSTRGPSDEVRLTPRRARLMACVIQEKGLKLAARTAPKAGAYLSAVARAIGSLPSKGNAWTDASSDDAGVSKVTFTLGPMGPRVRGEAGKLEEVANFLARLNQGDEGVAWRLDQARLGRNRKFRFVLESDPVLRTRIVERATDLAVAQGKGKALAVAVKAACPAVKKAPAGPAAQEGGLAWKDGKFKASPFFKISGVTTPLEGDLSAAADKLAVLPEGFTGLRLKVDKDGASLSLLHHSPAAPAAGAVKRWLQRARARSVAFNLPRWPWLERAPQRPPFPRGNEGWDLSGATNLRGSEKATLTEVLDQWVERQKLNRASQAFRALGYHQKITDLIFSCLFQTIQPQWPFARDGSIRPAVVEAEQRADEEARGASRRGRGPVAALRSFDGEQLKWRLRPPGKRVRKKNLQAALERCRVLDGVRVTAGKESGPFDGIADVAHAGGGRSGARKAAALSNLDASSRARKLLLEASKVRSDVESLSAQVKKDAGKLPESEGLGEVLRTVTNTARLQQLRLKLARRVPTPRSRGQVRHGLLELHVNGSRLGVIMLLDTLARSDRILLPIYWRWEEIGKTRWGKLRLLVDLPYLVRE